MATRWKESKRAREPCDRARALAQRDGRSVSENAPLQNKFGKRSAEWRTRVQFKRLRSVRLFRENIKAAEIRLYRESREIERRDRVCELNKRRTQNLATRRLFITALLRWRRLTAMTMHLCRRRLHLGSDHRGYCAMIRDREPCDNREQHNKRSESSRFIIHALFSYYAPTSLFN